MAPIKQRSVPKLELEASVLGVRLLRTVLNAFECNFRQVLFWTDSCVVLDWIQNQKKLRCSPSERNRSIHKTEPVELRSNRIEPRRSRNSRFETLRHFLQMDKRTRVPFEACKKLALKNARKPR